MREDLKMPRFLIELEHDEDAIECAHAVKQLLSSGSHFLTHADWGCKDGEHMACMIVEVDSKDEARGILPTEYRADAKIVQLNKFTLEEIDRVLAYHNRKAK